ncbi:glycosyltransferase family 4 protein [Flavobacterium franklandianum]|uniref:glycosyltransferase family 4 protein n=1 Tax=Flavobacterium franklandianum TaxID=2594430 RepID=UPI00117A8453|nr:glycosyltransferase family 4 protein [Flavobacterium franklandianum]TRX23167.1 glycosyltransferase family 4 protein [Flavobacterium franklandianum]
MENVLFITWDGPQTTYMEGLFMPILSQVQSQSQYKFHIVQFTWGTAERIEITQKSAQDLNLIYTSKAIVRKPFAILGTLFTLYKGILFLKKYIKKNNITIVMPRSTMPALMVNRMSKQNFKVVFDADGLPLEERIDFSGLSPNSKQYQFLKKEESKMLQRADGVLTRSHKAINIHSQTVGYKNSNKFSVVLNGRNTDFFKPNSAKRENMRKELRVPNQTKVLIYCGSLGGQYGWDEMMAIFRQYQEKKANAIFLILTVNKEFANESIPDDVKDSIVVKTVPFTEIPNYLSAADIAFAIREPQFSMQGIAPIKLGEYLLMGIPTIASVGIGDTEQILNSVPNCLLYDHQNPNRINLAVDFIESLGETNFKEIRKQAIPFFSIKKSAESYCNALDKLR